MTLSKSLNALQNTESAYAKANNSGLETSTQRDFFGELRQNYERAMRQVQNYRSANAQTARFTLASSYAPAQNQFKELDDSPLAAEGTFRVLEDNQLAYESVLDSGSLTFDLTVITSQPGATIWYTKGSHRGEVGTRFSEPSTATLLALIKAVWIIRVEKAGCTIPEPKEYDPFHQKITNVVFELVCKP